MAQAPSPLSPAAVSLPEASLMDAAFPPWRPVWRTVNAHAAAMPWRERLRVRRSLLVHTLLQPLVLGFSVLGGLGLSAALAALFYALVTSQVSPDSGWGVAALNVSTGLWFVLLSATVGMALWGLWKVQVVFERKSMLARVLGQRAPLSPPQNGQTWKQVAVVFGVSTFGVLPALVPNVFQFPCEERAKEAQAGLSEIAQAEATFLARHNRYGTLPELLEGGALARDPNQAAVHYRFVVVLSRGFQAVASDRKAPVNRNHPLDAWVLSSKDGGPTRYIHACRE